MVSGAHQKASAYDFDAIYLLFLECSMREAGIQEFFSEGNIVPLTLVYEDFVQEYEKTVRKVLEFLELDTMSIFIPSASLARTADELSEAWVGRFRDDVSKARYIEAGREKEACLRSANQIQNGKGKFICSRICAMTSLGLFVGE